MKKNKFLNLLVEILVSYGGWTIGFIASSKFTSDKKTILLTSVTSTFLAQSALKYSKEDLEYSNKPDEELSKNKTNHVERLTVNREMTPFEVNIQRH